MVPFDGAIKPSVVGRAAYDEEGGAQIAWAGTSATLRFRGSAVCVDITDNGESHYMVLIDGKPKREKITPSSGRTTVELIKGLPRGEHTITLYRLNEPLVGTSTVHGFVLDESGEPLPYEAEERPRIEILGDSISTGYGNEGADETCTFSAETQNHFHTYGARAARELGADLTTIAWSGKGIFTNRGSTSDTVPLPGLWKKTLPAEDVDYDFSGPAPQAVIINLGTNDFAPEVEDTSPFGPKYQEFLTEVREAYPAAHVFLTVGPLLSDEYPEGKKALSTVRTTLTEIVEKYRSEGDKQIHFLEFARVTPEEGLGCDFHPSIKTHSRMAATLARTLKEKAGF
jgi:lysophospholipase L1-like esterase